MIICVLYMVFFFFFRLFCSHGLRVQISFLYQTLLLCLRLALSLFPWNCIILGMIYCAKCVYIFSYRLSYNNRTRHEKEKMNMYSFVDMTMTHICSLFVGYGYIKDENLTGGVLSLFFNFSVFILKNTSIIVLEAFQEWAVLKSLQFSPAFLLCKMQAR